MSKTIASETIEIVRQETGFDKACDEAYRRALIYFGIDDCGRSTKIKGWDRSSCVIRIEFCAYWQVCGYGGCAYTYEFLAKAVNG